MAMLPTSPSRVEIYNMFYPNTQDELDILNNQSMRLMWHAIHGNYNYSREGFGGMSHVVPFEYMELVSTSKRSINVRVYIDLHGIGLPTGVAIKYREQGTTTWSYNPTHWMNNDTSISIVLTIPGLQGGTTYEIYAYVFNSFNSAEADWFAGGNIVASTQVIQPQPYNLSISPTGSVTGRIDASWDIDYDSYTLQIQWESVYHGTSLKSLSAGATSDSIAYGTNGDFIRYRIRYTSGGNTSYTAWTSYQEVIVPI